MNEMNIGVTIKKHLFALAKHLPFRVYEEERERERELDYILLSFLEFVSHVGVEAFHSIQTMLLFFLSLSL